MNPIQFPELPEGFWWAIEPQDIYRSWGSKTTRGYNLRIHNKRLFEFSSGKRWIDNTCASVTILDADKVAHNESVEGYNEVTLSNFRWRADNSWCMRATEYPDDDWLDECHLRTELLELTTEAILAHVPLALEEFEKHKVAVIATKERQEESERAEAASQLFVGSYPPKVLP